jgi:hypothetical protein
MWYALRYWGSEYRHKLDSIICKWCNITIPVLYEYPLAKLTKYSHLTDLIPLQNHPQHTWSNLDDLHETQNLQPVKKAVTQEVSKLLKDFSVICGCIEMVSPKSAPIRKVGKDGVWNTGCEVRNIGVSNVRRLKAANVESQFLLHNSKGWKGEVHILLRCIHIITFAPAFVRQKIEKGRMMRTNRYVELVNSAQQWTYGLCHQPHQHCIITLTVHGRTCGYQKKPTFFAWMVTQCRLDILLRCKLENLV